MPPTQQSERPRSILAERPGYFAVGGASLYTVLHQVESPAARVLLVGPFASERHTSYRAWVLWARYLAANGIEVLRFDYRGVGESTGPFAEMTLESWMEDVQLLSTWLRERGEDVPFVLHGLELGALLAARSFHGGKGDALILWSPPGNANQILRSTLQRWIGPQQLLKPAGERTPPSHYFRLLDNGESVEIDGYDWSPELWRQSLGFNLPAPMTPPNDPAACYKRPVRVEALGKNATPLVRGGVPGFEENKDFSWLFTPTYHWMASNLSIRLERS